MLEISDKDVIRSLIQDNPWWEPEGVPAIPEALLERAYFTPFYNLAMSWGVKRSTILMGPRRVGKTVMLHQLVRKVLSQGFPPSNILFASIDTPLYSGMPLEKILEYFERQTGVGPNDRRIVIFDEIQYLKNWEVHLKSLTDRYPNTKFIASGSAAAALRLKSQESGAGRFTDFLLPPLTFAEFLKFRGLEDALIQVLRVGTIYRYQTSDIQQLNAEFVNYLNYGGYPEAVTNKDIQQNIERYLGRDIIDKVLLRDLPSLYGIQDIQELNRLFTRIAYHSGREVSLDGLAQSSGVAKNTISKYLEYLEAAFLIVRVRRVDETGRTFKRMRKFKVYLTNPSMRAALFAPVDPDAGEMGALVETAAFSQWFHSDSMKNIHYANWKVGKNTFEVDLVRVHSSTMKPVWAYEIKWSDRFAVKHPEELVGIVEFAKKNGGNDLPVGATTRSVTSEVNVDGISIKLFPCALHCYQVGKNISEGRHP